MSGDQGESIYVWNPRVGQIAFLSLPVLLTILGLWLSLTAGPFWPIYPHGECTGKCYPPGFVLFLGIALSAGGIREIIRARRLVFYENVVKLVGKGDSPDQSFPYEQLTLGSLQQYRSSYYFVMSIDNIGRPLVFHIKNGRIKRTDQSLYDWIQDTAAEREELTPEILKAESVKSRLSLVTPVGILLGMVMVVLGPYVFWSINTPTGTPLIDSDIGFAVSIGGFILIAAILIIRGHLNARYTSH